MRPTRPGSAPGGAPAGARDVARALEPIDHCGDGSSRGQAGASGQLPGSRGPLAEQEADGLKVAGIEPRGTRDRVLEEHGPRHELAHGLAVPGDRGGAG